MSAAIVVNGREYPLDMTRVTLGEQAALKRILGQPITAYDEIDPRDPDVVIAMVWLAMSRADPRMTVERVEALTLDEIEFRFPPAEEEEEAAAGPPGVEPAGSAPDGPTNGNGGDGSAPGLRATTPAASGSLP